MASRGFIELLRLADLAKARQSDRHGDQDVGWRGVVFELGDQRLVVPLGEVSEVLSMPEYTMMPLVQPWLLGIANVRGRLLPLTDLAKFLQVSRQTSQLTQRKVIVIDHQSLFLGLIVDQVLGIEQFSSTQYHAESIDIDSPFAPYNHGKFVKDGQSWFIFLPSLLVEDPRYIDAAI
ncbi:chemotaxis protein CheW [Psychrobacter sp. 16-MNA-CIBAN-0192]|uniref:chemotaxis protein CheW n=1 Tax=Psychrobacter sp. 16-MNA-CIBAN-0192 TaxID=3140448 RepID=UPI003318FFA2